MKVSADGFTFPGFEPMLEVITVASNLRAADGTVVSGQDVVAFDTETGQVWTALKGPKGEKLVCFRHKETRELYAEGGRPYVHSPFGRGPENLRVLDENGDWEEGSLYVEKRYPPPLEIVPFVPLVDYTF